MERCRYQYQLEGSDGSKALGCKLNGAFCEFPANIRECPIVIRDVRECSDLLEELSWEALRRRVASTGDY